MRLSVNAAGQTFEVELSRAGRGWQARLEGRPVEVDFRPVDGRAMHSLLVDGRSYEVAIEEVTGRYLVTVDGVRLDVAVEPVESRGSELASAPTAASTDETAVAAPLAGVVMAVYVVPDQDVKAGEPVAAVEAMKMENELNAPGDGVVKEVLVKPGDRVERGQTLVLITSVP
jgi:biotin carboxyl carrier protein